jgi:hypothetical protein
MHELIFTLQVSGGGTDLLSVQIGGDRVCMTTEWSMKVSSGVVLALLFTIGFAVKGSAQDQVSAPPAQHEAVADAPRVLTGKERLGRKWTDEQRIDNCNVPPDKRGTKPRPTACARATAGF